MGKWGGFATGLALCIEYVCAPAAISTFIANYVISLGILPGIDPLVIVAAAYIIFIGIHIIGVGEALKLMFVISAIAIVALATFAFGMIPHFDGSLLFNVPADGSFGSSDALPYGVAGIVASLPFGIWFFLGVEGVPLAAEESANPRRDMPRGLIGALGILAFTGFLSLLLAAGGAGTALIAPSDAPLVDALNAVGSPELAVFVNYAALAGLIASFFSLMYAGSRQIFALSRAGYLPNFLALTGTRKTPAAALIISGIIGFVMVVVMHDGDLILNIAVFGACVSYALMNLSHVILRLRMPRMHRGYLTPGGTITTLIGFGLACVAIVSTFFVDMVAAFGVLGVYIVGMIYFGVYARHHLVANAPEEEFAQLNAAEAELR
jgi:ethanolamine permease